MHVCDSPESDLSVCVSRGNAVLFRVAGEAGERVPAALFVVFFQEKPVRDEEDSSWKIKSFCRK